MLKILVDMALNQIAHMLNIEEDMVEQWVTTMPMLQVVDSGPNSVYSATALLLNELGGRQQVLACGDISTAIAELSHQLGAYAEEE
jgi:hypothetical protein